ncbi:MULTISPECIES: hypothetical protein [Streptomyces]|uniref:hypothetical protein n=1 Tax=Streptomyces TaxID=1883 RepID=UPI001682CE68|nr:MULTISPECIES: hypothetical protein [Streptomyces]
MGPGFPGEAEGGDHHVHRDLFPAVAFHVLDDTGRLTTYYRTVLQGGGHVSVELRGPHLAFDVRRPQQPFLGAEF